MSRTRSEVSDLITRNVTLTRTTNGGSPVDENTTASWNSKSRTMIDVVTPGYKSLSQKGSIINNPLEVTIVEQTPVPVIRHDEHDFGWVKYNYDGEKFTPWDCVPLYPEPDLDSEFEALVNRAVTSAKANVNAKSASALVTLGEGKQTVNGMASILKRLLKIIRAAKKLDFKTLRGELSPKEIASRWLEIRYGLRPLIFEVQDIKKALSSTAVVGDRLTVRGYCSQEWEYNNDEEVTIMSSNFNYNVEQYTMVEYQVRAGVLSELLRESNALVWGLHDVPSAIWDLTTFSFILDWFVDFGALIAAWSPKVGLKQLSSWVTKTKIVTQTAVITGFTDVSTSNPIVTGSISSDKRWMVTKEIIREPDPTLVMYPQFHVDLNWKKITDILAIIGTGKKLR